MTAQLVLTLGEILKLWRERAGLTQRELGVLLELSRNTINRYESGGGIPRWRDVEAWADRCGQPEPEIAREAWSLIARYAAAA